MKKFRNLLLIILLFNVACTKIRYFRHIDKNAVYQTVLIKTNPSRAKIFINNQYMGKSPIKTKFKYSENRKINIKAEPLYSNQYSQNIYIPLKPIPDKITINMLYNARQKTDVEIQAKKRKPLQEPSKPKADKEVIIQEKVIVQEKPLQLPLIYFDFDQYTIPKNEENKLMSIINILKENPEYKIEIFGLADEIGNREYNNNLSLLRAKSVAEFLIQQSLSPDRIKVYALGQVSIINEENIKLEYDDYRVVTFKLQKS